MTNEELIAKMKTEIERMKGYYRITNPYDKRAIRVCENILSFLSTLESEKPMNPDRDLDKEINRFREIFRNECDARIVGEIANHFAKWGAEHLADVRKMIEPKKKEGRTDCSSQGEVPNDSLATQSYENIPNDLEEAKHAFSEERFPDEKMAPLRRAARIGYEAGAKWQAEQDQETIELAEDHAYLAGAVNEREKILSEAVEGEIIKDNRGNNVVLSGVFNDGFEIGDKVRVIIIKKED